MVDKCLVSGSLVLKVEEYFNLPQIPERLRTRNLVRYYLYKTATTHLFYGVVVFITEGGVHVTDIFFIFGSLTLNSNL